MPLLFDATMKELVGTQVSDYAAFLHLSDNLELTIINAELSTVSAATDVAIGLGEPLQSIVDLNFQSSADPELPNRVLLYSSVLRARYNVPVRSMTVLLRPKADHPSLTTENVYYEAGGTRLDFRFEVIRLWQQPAEVYLNAGLGVLPLAVLGALPEDVEKKDSLRDIVERIESILHAKTSPENAARLMQSTLNLVGLRVPKDQVGTIFRGIKTMKAAYDELLEEGAIMNSHKLLLLLGRQRFGPPRPEIESAIREITDLDRLERMASAILTVVDWKELLNTP